MERTVTFCFVWFSMKRLMMLRSPLTTSGDVDQSPSVASMDGWREYIRPKGLSEGKEPVTLNPCSGSGSGSVTTVSSATMTGENARIHPVRNEKLTSRREESGEEGETGDEWSQTHYDLGVPYLTGMRRK